MFNEFTETDNPEGPLRDDVAEDKALQQKSPAHIHPLLWEETQNILRDKIINVADLDKPLF